MQTGSEHPHSLHVALSVANAEIQPFRGQHTQKPQKPSAEEMNSYVDRFSHTHCPFTEIMTDLS